MLPELIKNCNNTFCLRSDQQYLLSQTSKHFHFVKLNFVTQWNCGDLLRDTVQLITHAKMISILKNKV